MKYSILINQKRAIEWELSTSEAVVFSWIYELASWAEKLIYEDKTYYFSSRAKACEELPIVTDKPDTMYRIYKSLEKKELISMVTINKKDYVSLTEKGKLWYYDDELPTDGKKSEESRKKIRENSEKNPTDKYISNNINNYKEYIDPFDVSNETQTQMVKVNYKEIVDKYNTLLGNRLPKVLSISENRKKSIKARVNEHGVDSVYKVLENVSHSDFLLGINDKNWQCNFDWIFKPTNYIKILEGNYKNKYNDSNMSTEYDNIDLNTPWGRCIEWMKTNTPRLLSMRGVITEENYKRMKKSCDADYFINRLKAMEADAKLNKNTDFVEAFVNYGTK